MSGNPVYYIRNFLQIKQLLIDFCDIDKCVDSLLQMYRSKKKSQYQLSWSKKKSTKKLIFSFILWSINLKFLGNIPSINKKDLIARILL